MINPSDLRPHYKSFLAQERVLLTGHSHQAWPDVAREGVLRAFEDACAHVDDKWSRAFEVRDEVRKGIAERMGANPTNLALGQNTHELVSRFLSALDWRARPRLVTTTGEFHSLRRQLARLEEEGVNVVWVESEPASTLAERVASEVDDRTAAALVSTVLFMSSSRVPNLEAVTRACHKHGALPLFDAYHAYNIVPFTLADFGSEEVFVTAGGYKYAQMGEGVCFLHVPSNCTLRPIYTGWYAEFARLEHGGQGVGYGRGADRFAGSTYDPTSHYRAASVLDFFDAHDLTVARLRALSLTQTTRIIERLVERLDAKQIVTPIAADKRGGFVGLRHARASQLSAALRKAGVYTDARDGVLRLGPAPYVTNDEIDHALSALSDLLSST